MGRLEEIEARAQRASPESFIDLADDVPWMLAEIAWLRGEVLAGRKDLRETIHDEYCSGDHCACGPLDEKIGHHDDPER